MQVLWRKVIIMSGEYKADTTVSDHLNDQRNSVYGIGAAKERKIELLSVQVKQKEKSVELMDLLHEDVLQLDSVINLGTVAHSYL